MPKKLLILRKKIESMDKKILSAIDQRFLLLDEIYETKKKQNLPLRDKKREQDLKKIAKHLVQYSETQKIYVQILKESLVYMNKK